MHRHTTCVTHAYHAVQGTVAVLHAHGVVHADLKPENILSRKTIQEDTACPEVVVTDFGSAFSVSETDTAKVAFEVQTLPYRAPEVCHPDQTCDSLLLLVLLTINFECIRLSSRPH